MRTALRKFHGSVFFSRIAFKVLELPASTPIRRSQSLKPGRETRIKCSPIDSDNFEGVLLVKTPSTNISDPGGSDVISTTTLSPFTAAPASAYEGTKLNC